MNESAESWLPVEDPLPSDSRFRKDLLALKEGDLVKAQVPAHSELTPAYLSIRLNLTAYSVQT